jgi:hypothetical protein
VVVEAHMADMEIRVAVEAHMADMEIRVVVEAHMACHMVDMDTGMAVELRWSYQKPVPMLQA